MKIYLAGPDVFKPSPMVEGGYLKSICARHGAEGLFPMDNKFLDTERGSLEEAADIRRANMALISECDAIVANLTPFRSPSMDVGTAYEMGVGAALKKIIVGYTNDPRSYVDRVRGQCKLERTSDGQLRDEQGMAVEEFRDGEGDDSVGLVENLMIACGMEALCETAEAAIIKATHAFRAKEALNTP